MMLANELERLMNSYGDYIIRLCYLYLKNWHLAEDAAQEVFIKVYGHLDDFRGEANEKTWISSIAINVCKNYRRTSWFRKVQIGMQGEETTYSMEEYLINKVQESNILKAIMKLPIKYREVILLYYYQELKISEIAKVLNISEGTVKMRLSRGRKRMTTVLMEVNFNGEMA